MPAAVEGSLRGGLRPPQQQQQQAEAPPATAHAPGPMASDDDDEGDGSGSQGVLEDGAGRRRHKAMNPTTRKQMCRLHSDVVVKRHKLRTPPVVTPCWRCLEVCRWKARGCWMDGWVDRSIDPPAIDETEGLNIAVHKLIRFI